MFKIVRNSTFRSIGTLTIVSSILTLSACSHINVNQMAYEALRKEDCRHLKIFALEILRLNIASTNFCAVTSCEAKLKLHGASARMTSAQTRHLTKLLSFSNLSGLYH